MIPSHAELMALLGGGEAANALGSLQDALCQLEEPEELARREMLALASNSGNFAAAVAAIDPNISLELCIERGWPACCFTACKCSRRCMIMVATQDGDFFDEQLRLLREAHATADADADTPRAKRAAEILTGSMWRHEMEGVSSPMLEALLIEEREAGAVAAARAATGSVEAVIVLQKGCCKPGRLALLGCSPNYLTYRRKRGDAGARASVPRTIERLPVEQALLADPCRAGCVARLAAENARAFVARHRTAKQHSQAEAELVLKRFKCILLMYDPHGILLMYMFTLKAAR